jgi:RimJ/RimL family protein N-acetyltransferase
MNNRRAVFRFTTEAGLTVKVYRMRPQDAENLVRLFEHLSETSRYQRFKEPLSNPDPVFVWQTAQRMATVDPKAGVAWIAFAELPGEPNAPVAGARYMRLPQRSTAEISIAVRDNLQRQGIGAQLLLHLARHARNNGVQRLVGTFNTGNRAVWRLVHEAPFVSTTTVFGPETEVIIDLSQPVEAKPGDIKETNDQQPDRSNLTKESVMPGEIVTTLRLNNGLELRVRPKAPTDKPRIAELLQQGSPEKRFERVGPDLRSPAEEALAEAARLIELSPSEGCVWLAFADLPGQPDSLVASGRFMRCSPDEGEMSVVVRDDMQGQGIGTKMLYFVLDQARAMGVKRMTSCFASDNEAVWQILSYSPYHVTWQPRGKQVEVVIHLKAQTEGSPSLN